ncbi:MAG: hypothetical protein CMN80_10630 [Spongiibacter sp.]|uniref:hypothetical protein n=1 Tax=Spongiibacter sp. TaxID=2024860 RepID=UPI000C0B24CD|nr:hypothetical protein [Spongiibacter sp.]MAK44593.1 hypothetical protein [Spongiibacter sp.]
MANLRRDADEVLEVGQAMRVWLAESGLDSRKPVELFSTLLEETSQYLRSGVDIEEAQFTVAEINARMKGIAETDDSQEVARRYVADNLKKYQELLAEHGGSLREYLRKQGRREQLVIASTESKGRNKKYYYLGLESVDDEGEEQVATSVDPRLVEYRVRKLPAFVPWAKPFAELTLEGWRRNVFVFGVVFLACLPLVVGSIALINGQLVVWQLGLISLSVLLLWMFYPLFSLVDRGIVKAPDWMLRLSDIDVQLELLEVGEAENGRPIRQIRLVKYEASCPVCGGHLAVVQGRREFRGRLIGRCSRSRSEHLYSFDHITKRGVPLRSNAYYGARPHEKGAAKKH